MHIHAVSVRVCGIAPPDQFGTHQSSGHPDHADGVIRGGDQPTSSPVNITPAGSPGVADGGPTVAGGTSAGSLSFGTRSGGRIDLVNRPISTPPPPAPAYAPHPQPTPTRSPDG